MDHMTEQKYREIEMLMITSLKGLSDIWKRIFSPKLYDEHLDKLKTHVYEFFKNLEEESLQKRDCIENEISALETEVEKLKRELNIDFTVETMESNPSTLLDVQAKYDHNLEKLRECYNNRKERTQQLCAEQEELCYLLGQTPLPQPQLQMEYIDEFEAHLQRLREMRDERTQEMWQLRREIEGYLKILELTEMTENEIKILNGNCNKLNMENILTLRKMHQNYKKEVENLHQEIDNIKVSLESLWERLGTNVEVREKLRNITEHTQSAYNTLKSELERCQAQKLQNIDLYVQKLRLEIVNWWEKTFKSTEERLQFTGLISENYTEYLMEEHEIELENLKEFYLTNKPILSLYSDMQNCLEKLKVLEAKAKDPNRYNNRGGQLLNEEKERKMISKKMSKIEQQINVLAHEYKERENKNFLIYGENILEVLARDMKSKLSATPKTPKRPIPPTASTLSTQKRKHAANKENQPTPGKVSAITPNIVKVVRSNTPYKLFKSDIKKTNRSSTARNILNHELISKRPSSEEVVTNQQLLNAVLVNRNCQPCSPTVNVNNHNLNNSPIII